MRSTTSGRGISLLTAAAVTLIGGCTPEQPRPEMLRSAPSAPAPTRAAVITTGLDAPWSIAFHRGTPLVSERDSARVLKLGPSGAHREVATLSGVEPGGEGGLLGLAVHDGYLYAYFTAANENRIERFRIGGEPGTLSLGVPETVIDGIPKAGNHNGGRIAFGPDGMLYATTGDAGVPARSQDVTSLGGKILRLTPAGDVPGDNPFSGSPVYSYGHRNAQGIGWSADGTMYSSEFGRNTWDELNVIEPGANYGWPVVEGIADRAGYVDPVQQWAPPDASPSGIAVTGTTVYLANLRGERLRSVPRNAPDTATESLAGTYGRLRDVVVAPTGDLWVLTNNTDGRGDPAAGDDRIIRVRTD